MICDITLCNTTEFYSYSKYSFFFTSIDIDLKVNCIGNACANSFATFILDGNYEQANIPNVAFDQHHLLLDQHQDLFNIHHL